jgi:hypothetical protein
MCYNVDYYTVFLFALRGKNYFQEKENWKNYYSTPIFESTPEERTLLNTMRLTPNSHKMI